MEVELELEVMVRGVALEKEVTLEKGVALEKEVTMRVEGQDWGR